MPWSSLANNQAISFNNLNNAVNTGVFIEKAAIPTSDECITKADANTYVYINTSKGSYAAKSSNQLVVKQDLEAVLPPVYLTVVSGLYPVTGPSNTTIGTIVNNNAFNIFIILSFNSGGVSSGTLNNDTLYIPSNSIVLNGKVITSSGQTITTQSNIPFGSGILPLPSNSTTSYTIDKFDGFGSGSTLRVYYSNADTGPYSPIIKI
jgi:hypothetical protein